MKHIIPTVTQWIADLTWICSYCQSKNLEPKLKCWKCSKPRYL